MRRTIRRYSRSLNQSKWQTVHWLAAAYAAQKDRFLVEYGRPSRFARHQNHRQARDELLTIGYQSPFGLQARMWKLALQDAIETIDRQWLALAEVLRPLVMAQKTRGHFTDEQARYAFWVLKSSRHMAQLVSGRAPSPLHFPISRKEQRRMAAYLRRIIRRKRGKDPRVRQVCSLVLDAEMYRVFEQDGHQYISIMTLTPGRRLVIPLTGRGPLQGNLRIVLNEEKRCIAVHQTIEVKPELATGGPKAVDLGVTEVMTDSDGDRWGEGLGQRLANYSDQICDRGSRREQVNASYSSQMCPRCGFVHRQNRRGDRFQCLFCGHGGESDAMAALNLLDRRHDPEIFLWTPKERVRAVLKSRFHRRLERWAFDFPPQQVNLAVLAEVGIEPPTTVPGRIRDTRPSAPSVDKGRDPAGQSESETP
ncbi:MAG: zinc ribbon domain-containing protein [Candidatus Bipolaricaulia bacterium]